MRVVFFVLLILLTLVLLFFIINHRFKLLVVATGKNKGVFFTLNHKFFTLVQGKVIILENGKASVIFKKIIKKEAEPGLDNLIFKNMLFKTKLKRVDIIFDSGKIKDAFLSALVSGTTEGVMGIVQGVLASKNVKSRLCLNNNLTNDDITISANATIKLSPLNALIAYIKSKQELKKEKEMKLCAKEIELNQI